MSGHIVWSRTPCKNTSLIFGNSYPQIVSLRLSRIGSLPDSRCVIIILSRGSRANSKSRSLSQQITCGNRSFVGTKLHELWTSIPSRHWEIRFKRKEKQKLTLYGVSHFLTLKSEVSTYITKESCYRLPGQLTVGTPRPTSFQSNLCFVVHKSHQISVKKKRRIKLYVVHIQSTPDAIFVKTTDFRMKRKIARPRLVYK